MILKSDTQPGVTASRGIFTRTEIRQQPDLWPSTLDIVRADGWINDNPSRLVITTGAGTSAYAADAIAASWPHAQAIPTTDLLFASSAEIERKSPGFGDSGLLLSIGRSGDSPESVAVVKRIKRMYAGVAHLAITCNANGELARTSGVHPIILDARTNDRSLAMTSSFSNLLLAGLCIQHAEELSLALPFICEQVQQRLPELDALADRLSADLVSRVVILGSGPLRALASEASLKILEMTAGRTATLAETFLGLRHGPMSFLTPDTLVLCFLSSSANRRRYEMDLIRELRGKQLGRIIGISPVESDHNVFDEYIPANAGHLRDELRTPFEIPFAQLLAYHLSLKQGLDPDNPSPHGAITRVVKSFALYDEGSDV